MFGYVIPCREKLNDCEWTNYRAAYCGLCHTLQQRYGFAARFLLNYDFTMLALLLSQQEQAPCVSCLRCVSGPIKGRQVRARNKGMDAAADISVLLTYWRVKDELADERGLRRIPAMALYVVFYRVFRRARLRYQQLNQRISEQMQVLNQLERDDCASIDRVADCFAQIMVAMVPSDWQDRDRRPLEQLLYQLGRWIYLIDAWDDMERDLRRDRYNPILRRYEIFSAEHYELEKKNIMAHMKNTLIQSENLAISAFHIGRFGYDSSVIENVLCAGLVIVRNAVFSGTWKKSKRIQKQELNRL